MARRIVVVSTYSDGPTGELLKKSVAELSVRRLLADWVVKGVSIRRRKVREINYAAIPAQRDLTPRKYIPATLPAVEVGNCRFVPPPTDARPRLATIRAGWDWTREPDLLPAAISA